MTDYNKKTRDDLRKECKARKLTRYSSLNKAGLVELLESHDEMTAPVMVPAVVVGDETLPKVSDRVVRFHDQATELKRERNRRKRDRRKLRLQGAVVGYR